MKMLDIDSCIDGQVIIYTTLSQIESEEDWIERDGRHDVNINLIIDPPKHNQILFGKLSREKGILEGKNQILIDVSLIDKQSRFE